MEIWTIEENKPILYERHGECNRCGKCCCKHTITYQMQTDFGEDSELDSEDDWSNWEGWSFFHSQGMWWYFRIDSIAEPSSPCGGLSENNECEDWMNIDTFKPICRYWPFHPDNIAKFSKCGFRFKKVKS